MVTSNSGPHDSSDDTRALGGGVRFGHKDDDRSRSEEGVTHPGTQDSPTLPGDDTPVDLTGDSLTLSASVLDGETRIGPAVRLSANDSDATQLITGAGGNPSEPGELSSAQDPGLTVGGADTIVPGGPGDGPLSPGHAFGSRYHIVSVVGVGGMGAVYKAWDQELGVLVALKVIRPEVARDPEATRALERRFKQELLLARKVTHRNVVRIHDLGEVKGIKYITMPFIEGEDLADILKRETRLPVPKVMSLARTMVSGLAAAHEAGIVHRDLKPANIMVDKDGEALIMDFGVARSASAESVSMGSHPGGFQAASAGHTVVGSVVGTVEYMAPEQARAEVVDQRADIYAVGLILYDMLLGRKRAAHAESAIAELTTRMQAAPPPLRQVDPSIPEPLERIVSRCVQPNPAARFQTTDELVEELGRLDDTGKLKPIQRALTRKLVFAIVLLAAGLVGMTWWLAPGRAPATQPNPVSLLVADFDNRTGEQVFNGALEQTLEKAMEGASFVNAYPRPQARQIAEQSIKAGNVLNDTVARLVARREMIDVVVFGSLQRDGSEYTLTLRAVSPAAEGGTPLASATADAEDAKGVLKAVGTAAADLRKRLGDTAEESVRLSAASTFTTSSPEAVKTFESGQELLFAGRDGEAYEAFRRTTQQDSNFAQAYSNAGIVARRLGRPEEAKELWKKALSLSDRISERERYRMLGSYYLDEAGNYEKAIDNFSTLMKLYPADRVGSAALALAHFWSLNIPKALEEGKRSIELDHSAIVRANYAFYAMYAGQYDIATTEIKKVLAEQPSMAEGYVPLAFAALARADWAQAQDAYDRMSATGPRGRSRASLGLADMAIYRGRYGEAEKILKEAIAADEKAGTRGLLAAKYLALAEAYEGQGRAAAAVEAARTSVKLANGGPLQVLAAGVLMRAGEKRDADEVRAFFSQQLTPQARAYGRILQGQRLVLERQTADAVDAFTEALKFKDMWLPRFNLGLAYAQAGAFAEALGELDRCQKRRGEAAAIFLDEVPSFRYLATLPYWLGKAHDALGATDAAKKDYESFLGGRGSLTKDPMVVDARARLAALGRTNPGP